MEKGNEKLYGLLHFGYSTDSQSFFCEQTYAQERAVQTVTLTELEQMKARRAEGKVLQNDITRYEFQLQSFELALTKIGDASAIINHQLVTTLHLPEHTLIYPDKNEGEAK